jgi:YVTN family beta-propeller protein
MKMKRAGWLIAVILLSAVGWLAFALAGSAKVYVADEESDTVSVLDAASFSKVATIPVGREPHNVQVSPDGKLAWVTNNGERQKQEEAKHEGMAKREHEAMTEMGQVWAIDTAIDTVVAKVPVGKHPAHVVLTPDGRFAYVTNGGENTVSVVDTEARRVVATIPVGNYPHGIRISPDGKQAYVANLKGGTVSVIDTEARKEVAQIPVGKGPAQVGFTPDGRLAFASLSQEEKVAVIDPTARKVIKKVSVGTVPIQVYATPDSRLLFVANQGTKKRPGKTVSVITLENLEVVKTLETGPGAHGVVVARDGRYAYVTNIYANSVSVIEVKDLKVVATVPVGKGPNGISVTACPVC